MNYKQLITKYSGHLVTELNYDKIKQLAILKMDSIIESMNDDLFDLCEDMHEYSGNGGLSYDNTKYTKLRNTLKKLYNQMLSLTDSTYDDLLTSV